MPAQDLAELMSAGFDPEHLPALTDATRAADYFLLLRELVRLGEADFVVRVAFVTEMAASDRTRWPLDAVHRHFGWVDTDARLQILRSLRRAGWLDLIDGCYTLSERGEALYAILARLLGIVPAEGDLALGVLNVELSRDLGAESTPALRHLHHNLRRIIDEAELAVTSHSEIRIEEARARFERNLAWARRARESIESVDLVNFDAYRVAQDVGRALSELHQWHAVLQRALNDIASKRVHLGDTGLSVTDVTAFLMRCDARRLSEFGRPLVSTPVHPPFFIVDNLLSEAEYELTRANFEPAGQFEFGWSEGPPDVSATGSLDLPEFTGLDRFVDDLRSLQGRSEPTSLAAFIPSRSWAESAYRLSLLALGEGGLSVSDTQGIQDDPNAELLRTVGLMPFEVDAEAGLSDRIYSDFASEISRGTVKVGTPAQQP